MSQDVLIFTCQNGILFFGAISANSPQFAIYASQGTYGPMYPRTSLFSDVRMGVTLDERHKARIERMMMEEEEEVKGLEVS